jgi:transcriptional regulator with XRE-family HTH domain
MTLAERLVSIREENGYTRKRLSDELGKPYATITKYENGQREPGHDYLLLIAKKFGVTVDYILGLETKKDQPGEGLVNDDPELTEYLKELQSRPEMKMLFHTFKSATKEQIEAIVTAWEARNNVKGE